MKLALRLMVCIAAFGLTAGAQESRTPVAPKPPAKIQIVTAAQANGVYRFYDNEFRILALGNNKLKIQFDGVYRTLKSMNMGYASGEATIEGNVAIFTLTDFGPCKITMVFLRNNRLKVTQEGSDADCGFGHNVYANGTYRKVRWGKPKFEPPPE